MGLSLNRQDQSFLIVVRRRHGYGAAGPHKEHGMKIANDVDYTRLPMALRFGPRLDLLLVTVDDGRFMLNACVDLELAVDGHILPTGRLIACQKDGLPAEALAGPKPQPRQHLRIVS
jgi:hypothetical protein